MAPRVLLIHGYLSCPEAWAPLQRELAGEIETFAPNQAGYGPAADPSDYTPDGLAEAFDATLDAFQPDYLLGHSMGALVALQVAIRHPGRFRRVGLAGLPIFNTLDDGLRFTGVNSRVRDRFLRHPERGHIICGPLHALRHLWAPILHLARPQDPLPMLLRMFNHSEAAHRGGLQNVVFAGHAPTLAARVSMPVTLFHGDRDRVTAIDPVLALARERGWPLRIGHGVGHEVIFAQPQGVARWVRERLVAREAVPVQGESPTLVGVRLGEGAS